MQSFSKKKSNKFLRGKQPYAVKTCLLGALLLDCKNLLKPEVKYLLSLILIIGIAPFCLSQNIFIENNGQIKDQFGNDRSDVHFKYEAGNKVLFITNDGFSIQQNTPISEEEVRSERIDFSLVGFKPNSFKGLSEATYTERHCDLNGSTEAKSYQEVICKDESTGIMIHFYSKNGGFKYDIILPESNMSEWVEIMIGGASVELSNDEIIAGNNEFAVVESLPGVWHESVLGNSATSAKYEVTSSGYRIQFNKEVGKKLVIDPYVKYGSYYGGSGTDGLHSVAVDADDNFYGAGTAHSSTNIATTGAYQSTWSTIGNLMLVKFNQDGQRQWGTYYHTQSATPIELVIDDQGYIFMAGYSLTALNIGTPGAHQDFHGGDFNDAFIIKFTPDGFPIWSTMYGGNGNDVLYQMEEFNGHLYLVGGTGSDSLIATPGSWQDTKAGTGANGDGFLAKFDTSGVLVEGTYVGGFNGDQLEGLCIADGYLYMTGTFNSWGLGTAGVYQETKTSNSDQYMCKFTTDLDRLWGSYFSGNSHVEFRHRISVRNDKLNIGARVHQGSNSTSYSTPNTHKEFSTSGYDIYLLQFDTSGTNWEWGTYYGGTDVEHVQDIYHANDSTIVIAGSTYSFDSIATPNVHKDYMTYGVASYFPYPILPDAFVAVFDTTGHLKWGSYYGGEGQDDILEIELNSRNEIVFAGTTKSMTGIAFGMAHQGNNLSNWFSDGFIGVFDLDRDSVFTDQSDILADEICPKEELVITYDVQGTYFDDNIFELWMSDEFGSFSNPTLMATQAGTTSGQFTLQIPYLVTGGSYAFRVNSTSPAVQGSNSDDCDILASPMTNFNYTIGASDVYFTDISDMATSWDWDFTIGISNAQNPIFDFGATGSYLVTLVSSNGICSDTASHTVVIDEVTAVQENEIFYSVYPNPTRDQWSLQLASQINRIEIYNLQGKLVYESIQPGAFLEVSDLMNGSYILKLYGTDNQLVGSELLIKL